MAELVFVPTPGAGHLLSLTEFAKRLLLRHETLSVTILLMIPVSAPTVQYAPAASDAPRIRFINLPKVDPPSTIQFSDSPERFATFMTERYKTHVRDAIADHVLSRSEVALAGLVLDMFCTAMIDVGKELGVPSYVYLTPGANFLGYMMYLPVRHELAGGEFTESDTESIVPSFVNPVPSSVLPEFSFNKLGYSAMLGHAKKFKEARGIIVNTFAELESHAVESFLSSYDQLPPVYTVGPMFDQKGQERDDRARRIMEWLDDQPPSSVVFLCFGSLGSFGEAQLREIADGLGRSGARFLWAVRKPRASGKFDFPGVYGEGELEGVLPREFLEKADGTAGLICGWAPQAEVLAHQAVGGFVSHCWWNSVQESLWYGVPVAAWPMYAEQQLSAFELVRELGVAVEVRLGYRIGGGDVVKASEVENAVRKVMESESDLRKKVKELSEKSRTAVAESGSSFESIGKLIRDILDQLPETK